jgi:hypothetical protein
MNFVGNISPEKSMALRHGGEPQVAFRVCGEKDAVSLG